MNDKNMLTNSPVYRSVSRNYQVQTPDHFFRRISLYGGWVTVTLPILTKGKIPEF
jgi:hypothetical protein